MSRASTTSGAISPVPFADRTITSVEAAATAAAPAGCASGTVASSRIVAARGIGGIVPAARTGDTWRAADGSAAAVTAVGGSVGNGATTDASAVTAWCCTDGVAEAAAIGAACACIDGVAEAPGGVWMCNDGCPDGVATSGTGVGFFAAVTAAEAAAAAAAAAIESEVGVRDRMIDGIGAVGDFTRGATGGAGVGGRGRAPSTSCDAGARVIAGGGSAGDSDAS
jgi:hypothetical protein